MAEPSPPLRLGLIAGSGRMPLLLAEAMSREVRRQGGGLYAVGHVGETDPALVARVDGFSWVRLGQFKKILDYFGRMRVDQAVLAGGITKSAIWRVRPDILALRMAGRLRHLNDDALLRGVAALLAERGIRVRAVTDFVPELLVPQGVLGRLRPSPFQWEEARFAWGVAKEIGRLDIGQGVVVRQRVVVAVEAMEGTDAMLERAGILVSGRQGRGEAVFVKVAKPFQDRRLDLPTIGPETIRVLARSGIPFMAVEAGSAMMIDPAALLGLADREGIVVIGCRQEDWDAGRGAEVLWERGESGHEGV
ncbi:MAG: UDP-2,3-diacylglucosamine diphosphatase LpxI [Magnetococcales bacterium]|nr:UDP-2,3-diacylglucosamine diphosphatase LpxI [Magnetococcales bacterium]